MLGDNTFSSPHCFELESAWWLWVGLVPAVFFMARESLRLDDVGGEARGA